MRDGGSGVKQYYIIAAHEAFKHTVASCKST